MLNLKRIERLLAENNINPKTVPYGALLHAAAALKSTVHPSEPEWSREELLDALHSKKPLFAMQSVKIDPQEFVRVFEALRTAAVDAMPSMAEKLEGMPGAQDFFTQERLDALCANPEAIWEMLEKDGVDVEAATELFVLVAIFALRVFFDDAASRASDALDRLEPDTVHFERSLKCPVCGATAAVGAVQSTQNRGNIKRLYCTCCGAHWRFERIRCALCGDEAVSDLQYVHLQGDDKHRLHVCANCGGAMPTIFGVDEDNFDPNLEHWRCGELMAAYVDMQSEQQKPAGNV